MLKPGLSILQANQGHVSRLLILVLLKLDTFGAAVDWSDHWKHALKEFNVIPDVLSDEPSTALGVVYNIFIVNFGEVLTPFQIQNAPTRMYWPVDEKFFYTLVVTGPDAPTRDHATKKEWIHWLIVNIPGNQWLHGETIIEYQGDTKSYGSGPHRCVYIAFKQPKRRRMRFNENRITTGINDELRGKFSTSAFAEKYNLSNPVAANFFIFESDFARLNE